MSLWEYLDILPLKSFIHFDHHYNYVAINFCVCNFMKAYNKHSSLVGGWLVDFDRNDEVNLTVDVDQISNLFFSCQYNDRKVNVLDVNITFSIPDPVRYLPKIRKKNAQPKTVPVR